MKGIRRTAGLLGIIFLAINPAYGDSDVYAGGSLVNTSYNYSDLSNSNGSKFFAGYRFANGFLLEAGYQNLGDSDVDGLDLTLNVSGTTAFLGYDVYANKFGFFGKLGLYSFDTEVEGPGGSISESSNGLAWGFGMRYEFTEYFGIRGELESFIGVEDFADDETVSNGSVGLELRF